MDAKAAYITVIIFPLAQRFRNKFCIIHQSCSAFCFIGHFFSFKGSLTAHGSPEKLPLLKKRRRRINVQNLMAILPMQNNVINTTNVQMGRSQRSFVLTEWFSTTSVTSTRNATYHSTLTVLKDLNFVSYFLCLYTFNLFRFTIKTYKIVIVKIKPDWEHKNFKNPCFVFAEWAMAFRFITVFIKIKPCSLQCKYIVYF